MKRLVPLLIALGLLAGGAAAQSGPQPASFWWNDRVFYEIFVRSFYDSDGDGVGDLRGVIEKLDYLNDGDPATTTDLGVTGLWLMPINPAASYHGYDVRDYYDVAPRYGTLDDMRALIEAAHARGIAIIIDLVLNHTSTQHPWFLSSVRREPEHDDWYVWSDSNPGYRGPDGQQVWHQLGGRYYYGIFWSGMPDLNLANPEVTAEVENISRFWLEEVGVDGFRLDAIKHLVADGEVQENAPGTHAWLHAYNAFVDSVNPNAITVGEAWSASFAVRPYVRDGEVDLAFSFDLATAMLESASRGTNSAVSAIQQRDYDLFPPNQFGAFLANHDQNRVINTLSGSIDRARMAASMLLTGPGVPFLYYGEEIGMQGQKPDERIRTPMQWDDTPLTAGFTTASAPWQTIGPGADDGVSVAAQTSDSTSLLSHYRALIALRNANPALQRGSYTGVDCNARRLLAFLRQTEAQTVLVLMNLSDEPVSDYTCEARNSGLRGTLNASLLFGAGQPAAPQAVEDDGGFSGYVPLPEVPPYSTTVIVLDAGD
jgi:alpha-amylase